MLFSNFAGVGDVLLLSFWKWAWSRLEVVVGVVVDLSRRELS